MYAKVFSLLFIVWTLCITCILYAKLFFLLSSQYFVKVFVCGFIILLLYLSVILYLYQELL
jgi:hypothetical protein